MGIVGGTGVGGKEPRLFWAGVVEHSEQDYQGSGGGFKRWQYNDRASQMYTRSVDGTLVHKGHVQLHRGGVAGDEEAQEKDQKGPTLLFERYWRAPQMNLHHIEFPPAWLHCIKIPGWNGDGCCRGHRITPLTADRKANLLRDLGIHT